MTEGCDKIKVCCIGAGVMGGALMKSVIQAVGGENLTVTDSTKKLKSMLKDRGVSGLKLTEMLSKLPMLFLLPSNPQKYNQL